MIQQNINVTNLDLVNLADFVNLAKLMRFKKDLARFPNPKWIEARKLLMHFPLKNCSQNIHTMMAAVFFPIKKIK